MIEDLQQQIGETFIKDKNGIKTKVILCQVQVRSSKVTVRCPDRQDSFKLPINEFLKKYKLVETASA